MQCHALKAIWLLTSSFKLITQRTPGNFIHKFQILNIHVRQRIKLRNRRSALASHFSPGLLEVREKCVGVCLSVCFCNVSPNKQYLSRLFIQCDNANIASIARIVSD